MKKFLISFLISLASFILIFSLVDRLIFPRDASSTTGRQVSQEGDDEEIKEDKPKQVNKDELVFLLMGIDTHDIKKNQAARSDTMMVGSLNFETGKVKLLSIPRDTRVLIKGKEDKINHAHSKGGADLSLRTVRDFLNIDLDYYVKVDYQAVIDIVDDIGGVYFDVPRRMEYDDPKASPPLHIDLHKGPQLLNGKESHDLLRWRNNNDKTLGYNDIGRIQTQQAFMKELAKHLLKPKNIFKLPGLIETYYDYVETNIPLTTMARGALSARKLDMDGMEASTIPGYDKTIANTYYWIYNVEETEEIVKGMFGDYLLD